MSVEEVFQSKKNADKLIKEFTVRARRNEDPLIKYWMERKRQKEKEKEK